MSSFRGDELRSKIGSVGIDMREFNELLGIGLDSRGKRFATEMGGVMKFKFDRPKPKPNVWDTPEFIAKNRAIGIKAAEESQAYLEAVRATKNLEYVAAFAMTDLIHDLRRRKWVEKDIGLFIHNQKKIARRLAADRKKVNAAAGISSDILIEAVNPYAALDNKFKFPTTQSQGPQYEPKPRTRHFEDKKKAAS